MGIDVCWRVTDCPRGQTKCLLQCFFQHFVAYIAEPLHFMLSACENAHASVSAVFSLSGHSAATLAVNNHYEVWWNNVQYCLAGGAELFQQICLLQPRV